MTGRRLMLPVFGKTLRELRGSRTRAEICRALARYGLRCDKSTLLQYENGRVMAPDPAILWALGRIYQKSMDELMTMLARERTGKEVRGKLGDPTFTLRQVQVAEWFGGLPDHLADAVYTLVTESLPMSTSSLSPERRRRRA